MDPPTPSSTDTSTGSVHQLAVDHLPLKKPNTTRFVLLSDTHTHTFPVPDGDVLLHAGDLTQHGSEKELKTTLDWLCSLPHKYKIIIAGNHDYCLDGEFLKESMPDKYKMYLRSVEMIEEAKDSGLIYIQDSLVEIPVFRNTSETQDSTKESGKTRKTWKIFGSPWSAAFCSMAFNIPRGKASKKLYAQIPDDTDILLTHGPPFGMLDVTIHGHKSVGCDMLLERIQTGLPDMKLHIWGHIHEDRGVIIDEEGLYGENARRSIEGDDGVRRGTIFANAANAGTWERPKRLWGEGKYQPMVVDLNND